MITHSDFAQALRAGNIFYKFYKSDLRSFLQLQGGNGNKLGVRVILENNEAITAIVPKFTLVEWEKETNGSITVHVTSVPVEIPVRIYHNNSNTEILNTPIISNPSEQFYFELNNGDLFKKWDLCLFTKAQLEAIFNTTGSEVVISGSTINYSNRFFNIGNNFDPNFDYFTLKIEANESETSGVTINNEYGSAVIEIAAPCPPLWDKVK